jgi:choline dehydrogenase-like flavoprotein
VNAPLETTAPRARFSARHRRILLAFAEAILPGDKDVRGADERTVVLLERYLGERGAAITMPALGVALTALDTTALAFHARPFHKLSRGEAQVHLERLLRTPGLNLPLNLLTVLFKLLHFDEDAVIERLGARRIPVAPEKPPAYMQNVSSAASQDPTETLECDVVVIGTGAGGAVVGAGLAERGHAVLLVEEGEYLRRHDFVHSQVESIDRYYRGGIWALGNCVFPIFTGKLVGGSTAINTGTSLRPPRFIMDEWCERIGSDEIGADAMTPYFDQVEQTLGVRPNERKHIGPIADVIGRGCDRLGWSHYALPRNAPDCEGQGYCSFGCRTDARRSTNVSYVPKALENNAMLLTGFRADRILVENGRAVGVEGVAAANGNRITVRARAVVLAANAINTPLLLAKQGLANSSGELGKNLTLHPSTGMFGVFEERIDGQRHIPQGYGTQEFIDEGILINAAQTDPTIFAITIAVAGEKLMEAVKLQDHVAGLGILAHDQGPGGRVWWNARGVPVVTYNLCQKDVETLHKGVVRGAQMFIAAGAKKLYPGMTTFPVLESPRDLDRLIQARPKARDFTLVSYHPLGTAKMGKDPRTSVVDLHQESHDVRDLFIVDGSSIPGAPAVNPQITIMAYATRAAEHIHARL